MSRLIVRSALAAALLLSVAFGVSAQSSDEGRRAATALCASAPKSVCRILWSIWHVLSVVPSVVDARAIDRLHDIDEDPLAGDDRMLPVSKIIVETVDAARICLSVTADRYGWNDSPYRRANPASPVPADTAPASWLAQRTLSKAWLETLEKVQEVNASLKTSDPNRALSSTYLTDWSKRVARCDDLDLLSSRLAALAGKPAVQVPDLGIDDASFVRTASEIRPLKQWDTTQFPAWPRPLADDALNVLKTDWARPALDAQQSYCYEAGTDACHESGMWLLGVLMGRSPDTVSNTQFRSAGTVLRVSGGHCFIYGRHPSSVRSVVSTRPRGRMLDYQGFVAMRDAAFSVRDTGGAETYEQAMDPKSGFMGRYWPIREKGQVMSGDDHCRIALLLLREPARFQSLFK